MIAKLTGIIDSVFESKIILDVSGVGYEITVPTPVIESVRSGDNASFLIAETMPQDSAPVLYGFSTRHEKELFHLLTTVQGVGPKASMAILSVASVEKLVGAVISGDTALISRASGVGQKTAARVVSELKDKIGKVGVDAAVDGISAEVKSNPTTADAISALVNLGYPKTEAGVIVSQVMNAEPSLAVGEVIRKSLAKFT
ncbi:MAG: Holliday junction branch migration protein RuvA [Alphaproteobacteria bacterium]|nr:Holliday junction branch migration protein RuvA [Alphaproteobacteria bacterium]